MRCPWPWLFQALRTSYRIWSTGSPLTWQPRYNARKQTQPEDRQEISSSETCGRENCVGWWNVAVGEELLEASDWFNLLPKTVRNDTPINTVNSILRSSCASFNKASSFFLFYVDALSHCCGNVSQCTEQFSRQHLVKSYLQPWELCVRWQLPFPRCASGGPQSLTVLLLICDPSRTELGSNDSVNTE